MEESNIEEILTAIAGNRVSTLSKGVSRSYKEFPKFANAKDRLALSCDICSGNSRLRRRCIDFYSSLPAGDGKRRCPFGVEVLYRKLEDRHANFILSAHLRFNPKLVAVSNSRDQSRVEKKLINRIREEGKSFDRAGEEKNAYKLFDDLQETLEVILDGRLAATLRATAHSMLTPVQGALADADRIGESEEAKRLRANLGNINRLSKRLQVLVSEQLTVNSQTVRKVTVHAIVDEICDALTGEASRKNIKINHGYNSGLRQVEAVPEQLELVLSAIIENAIKYSFTGTDKDKRYVEILYREVEDKLSISVMNYGCYITPEEIEMEKVYELGYRGIYASDRSRKGTGTGLFIVKRICEAHGAKLNILSREVGETTVDGTPVGKTDVEIVWPHYLD